MTHSYTRHDAFICMPPSYVWHDSFTHYVHMRQDSFISSLSYMQHDPFTWATWLIRMCDMTHSYVWHDSSTCATWLIHICDMTHPHRRHDSFVCATVHTRARQFAHNHMWQKSCALRKYVTTLIMAILSELSVTYIRSALDSVRWIALQCTGEKKEMNDLWSFHNHLITTSENFTGLTISQSDCTGLIISQSDCLAVYWREEGDARHLIISQSDCEMIRCRSSPSSRPESSALWTYMTWPDDNVGHYQCTGLPCSELHNESSALHNKFSALCTYVTWSDDNVWH